MDPLAKRFMWEVISRLSTRQGKTAVILTTHSMNEAQALCTRIGIMVQFLCSLQDWRTCVRNHYFASFVFDLKVGGRLRCIGSPQHLKTRFGNHLELEVCMLTYELLEHFKESNSLFPVLRLNLLKSVLWTWQTFAKLFKKGFLTFLLTQEVYLMTLKFALGVLIW